MSANKKADTRASKEARGNASTEKTGKPGPKKKLDVSMMAIFALLVVRYYRAPRTVEARGFRKAAVDAAIRAWFDGREGTAPKEWQIAAQRSRVSKELQRLERITETAQDVRPHIHGAILHAFGWVDPTTGGPVLTAEQVAASVAEFLPPSFK